MNINFTLTQVELDNLLQFLSRVQLTGAEAPALMSIIMKIQRSKSSSSAEEVAKADYSD